MSASGCEKAPGMAGHRRQVWALYCGRRCWNAAGHGDLTSGANDLCRVTESNKEWHTKWHKASTNF